MIFSNEHKFIILKNPKTGSTSLRKHSILRNYADQSRKIFDQFTIKRICENTKRKINDPPFLPKSLPSDLYEKVMREVSSIDDIQEKTNRFIFYCFPIYGNFQYYIDLVNSNQELSKFFNGSSVEEYTPYVILREPIDRFKSVCRHITSKADNGFGLLNYLFKEEFDKIITKRDHNILHLSPQEFIRKIGRFPVFSDFSDEYKKLYDAFTLDDVANKLMDIDFLSADIEQRLNFLKIDQKYYCMDERVKIIDYNKLQQNIDFFCNQYGLKIDKLPFINKESHEGRDSFSQQTLKRVTEFYAIDIEIYNKKII